MWWIAHDTKEYARQTLSYYRTNVRLIVYALYTLL